MNRILTGTVLAAALMSTTAAGAQSLGDVARQEAERRKTMTARGKIYTNGTLRAEPPPLVRPTPAPVPPEADEPSRPSAAAAAPAQQGEDDPRTEPYWRKRMTAARGSLARAEQFAEALQTRINVLSADFANRDDPAQRNVIAADRLKALAELDRLKAEIAAQQKAIIAIQDDARRAGVPIGWVR